MVRIRKDKKAIPFPRRLSRTEIERFWMKLIEDVTECWEVMPNKTTFMRCFGELMYDSFSEAKEYYQLFKNSVCRGEEPEIPEEKTGIRPLGKSVEDGILIVTGRLYSNEKNCSIEAIIDEVNKVRKERPSRETVKEAITRAWKVKEAKRTGISHKNEEELSWYMLASIPKECLEAIIGEALELDNRSITHPSAISRIEDIA